MDDLKIPSNLNDSVILLLYEPKMLVVILEEIITSSCYSKSDNCPN